MKNILLKYICLGLTTVALALPSACTGVTSNPTEIEPRSPIMVATANPHATEAGLEVLRSGGSAVDAAVAIAAVLSLVEPQSSGLAGGAFMVHFENDTKTVAVYDGRETAPGLID
ncbi:MAG: gamma-glutamyltransferase, partial [Gammaproteobacteria bacterium]|nr:gamma-glutamyltransferase [Gammaproteobacteria bacterium]